MSVGKGIWEGFGLCIRSITMRRARTWGWPRTRRYDDPSSDLGPSSSHQSYPAYIINTRGPPMTKAELRAQGIQALAQVTTPIIKLPMKIRRQCGRCSDFNSVLVEPGQAVPAFKCLACGFAAG